MNYEIRAGVGSRGEGFDFGLGARIVANLKVGVFEEVHRMHFVMQHVDVHRGHLVGNLDCGEIGIDVVLPESQAREDVRRHVNRVGGGGRDAGVFAGRGQSEAGHRGIVAAVNDVVGDAGMVGLILVQFVENGDGGFGVDEVGVAFGRRAEESKGVQNRGFTILGIALVDAVHGLRVGFGALFVIDFSRVGVKDCQRLDVVTLARGRRIKRTRFHQQFRAALEIGLRRAIPELVIQAHRLAPVGHRAARIFFLDFFKLIDGGFVLEGVKERHAALKLRLHRGRTGGRERHSAELFAGVVMMMRFVLRETGGHRNKDGKKKNGKEIFHRTLQTSESVAL